MVRFEVTWSLTVFHGANFPRNYRSPIRLHLIAGLVPRRAILSCDEKSRELSCEIMRRSLL